MVSFPLSCHCCRVRTVTGAGVVRSLRRTREPVTVICSSIGLVPGASSPLGGGSCGMAPGGGCSSVCVVCADASPADRRRMKAALHVIRLEFMLMSPRGMAMDCGCSVGRRLLSLAGHSQIGAVDDVRVLTSSSL